MSLEIGWRVGNINNFHTEDAVEGCVDADGYRLYVGRSYSEGTYHPVIINPKRRSSVAKINGKLIQVRNFEFLSRPLNPGVFYWTKEDTNLSNDTIFIRLDSDKPDLVRRCAGRHQMTELDDSSSSHEVLAYTIPAVQWVTVGNGRPFPSNAIQAGIYRGHGVDHKQYIARCRHESSVLIGYAYNYKDKSVFHTGFWNQEIQYYEFEVLVENYAVFPREVLGRRK